MPIKKGLPGVDESEEILYFDKEINTYVYVVTQTRARSHIRVNMNYPNFTLILLNSLDFTVGYRCYNNSSVLPSCPPALCVFYLSGTAGTPLAGSSGAEGTAGLRLGHVRC